MQYDKEHLEAFAAAIEHHSLSGQEPLELEADDAQEMVELALFGDDGPGLEWEPAPDGESMQLVFDGEPVPVSLSPDNTLSAGGQPIGIVEEADGQIISSLTEEPLSADEICEQIRAAVQHQIDRPEIESSPDLELQDEDYLEHEPEIPDGFGYESPSLAAHDDSW